MSYSCPIEATLLSGGTPTLDAGRLTGCDLVSTRAGTASHNIDPCEIDGAEVRVFPTYPLIQGRS